MSAPSLDEALAVAKRIQPTGDRLLVLTLKNHRYTGALYIPDGTKTLDLVVSRVLARGPEVKLRTWELAVGDYVLHVRVSGVPYDGVLGALGIMSQTNHKDSDFRFLHEHELMCVVDPAYIEKVKGEVNYSEGKTGTVDLSKV